MSHRYIVTDGDSAFLVEGVQDGAVLDIHVIANLNPIDIAAQYSVEPDGATITDDGITDDSCILC